MQQSENSQRCYDLVLAMLALLGVGATLFFNAGGIKNLKEKLKFGDVLPKDPKKGELSVPLLQSGKGTIPISAGSRKTVTDVEEQDVLRTTITSKRKFDPSADKPKIQTVFNNPKQGGVLASQVGQIVGRNLSIEKQVEFGKGQFGLNVLEIQTIRGAKFTEQEIQDIANLRIRFDRKSVSAQKVSDQPEEIILKKREQEAISKKVLQSKFGAGAFTTVKEVFTPSGFSLTGGKPTQEKLFAKPNFIFGGISESEFLRQRAEKADEFARLQENKRLAEQQIETGKAISSMIVSTGLTQKEFLLTRGIGLRGSALNERALAKLQARGLI